MPSGLPALALPPLHGGALYRVLATAASCFVVIVAQSAATARAYAVRYNERADENVDLIGLAGANAAAALTGTFVVNGSPTKTEMVDEAGGRSQVAHLTTAAIVLLVLLFLTKPLGFLPSAVLSAIVFMIGVKLIDLRGLRELFRLQRNEFYIALATAATVVFSDVMHGIAVAVALSLIEHVRHTYRPRTRLLTCDASGQWHAVPVAPGVFAAPGIVVYRFEADLFYANASRFMDEVLALVSATDPPVRGFVIDASGIDDIDYSAAKTLLQLRAELQRRGVRVAGVAASEDLRDELARYGIGVGAGPAAVPVGGRRHRRAFDHQSVIGRQEACCQWPSTYGWKMFRDSPRPSNASRQQTRWRRSMKYRRAITVDADVGRGCGCRHPHAGATERRRSAHRGRLLG